MQTRSPFFDELAKTMENAMGVAQAAGEEARAAVRAQADRLAAELDLVRRDEFDAMRAALETEIAGLRSEIAQLNASTNKARPSDDVG
jgi:BMFP domain-containing protein YqiC